MSFDLALLIGSAIGRLLVGAILLIAGAAKLRAGQSRFLKDILAYELLPHWASYLLAHWLPAIEVLTGGLLIVGLFAPLAPIAGFTLLLVFAGAVGLALWRGKEINCGCFGTTNRAKAQWKIVYRNLALMAMLLPAVAGNIGWLALFSVVWLGAVSGSILIRLFFHSQTEVTNTTRSAS